MLKVTQGRIEKMEENRLFAFMPCNAMIRKCLFFLLLYSFSLHSEMCLWSIFLIQSNFQMVVSILDEVSFFVI